MKMLDCLVTEAEKEYGSGTGALKLASVVEKVYPKLPAIINNMPNEYKKEFLELVKKCNDSLQD